MGYLRTNAGIHSSGPVDFAKAKWSKINEICDAGKASEKFQLKAEKQIALTDGEIITVQIADFNHDEYTAGGTAPMTFIMKDCLKTARRMNSSNTNSGGWKDSAMRAYCNGELLNRFPADLKALIKPVNKKGYIGTSSTIQTTSDSLWLLSEVEIFGASIKSVGTAEGTKYPIFTDNASGVKRVNGASYEWWERSPWASYSDCFCSVYSGGTAGNRYASLSYGVAVGFCI